MEVENCENCYFSKEAYKGTWLCRRYPPSVGALHNNYPEVNSGKWCGEHQLEGTVRRWKLIGTMYEEGALNG